MKAIQVIKPGELKIIDKEKPRIIKENEVLIKVKATGICGSDMHIYHGTSPVATYPRVIGHEFVGEVIETGKNASVVKIGDKVIVEPIIYCGKCYACKTGRQNVCENLEVLGVHKDGGFQEYIVVEESKAHKFDNNLSWEEAVLIEPFTIAAQANWHGNVKDKDVVYIVGAGPIGLTILQYAKYKGAICITSDIDDEKLEKSKGLGADYTLNPNKVNIEKEIRDITNGMGANVIIDAVGLPQVFEQAVNIVSNAGRIVILGFTDQPSTIAQLPITKKEITICGSRLQTNKFPEVVELFNNHKLSPKLLISHVFDINDINKAIQLIENQSEKTCKVIMKFN